MLDNYFFIKRCLQISQKNVRHGQRILNFKPQLDNIHESSLCLLKANVSKMDTLNTSLFVTLTFPKIQMKPKVQVSCHQKQKTS